VAHKKARLGASKKWRVADKARPDEEKKQGAAKK
jgi:hypothetical protein